MKKVTVVVLAVVLALGVMDISNAAGGKGEKGGHAHAAHAGGAHAAHAGGAHAHAGGGGKKK